MHRHSPSDIVQVVVKDGDDTRNLVLVVWAQLMVVGAKLGVGLIWALVRGWQLTLAGFAIAPVFAGVMALQMRLVVQCEARNNKAREDVARGYYDVHFVEKTAIISKAHLQCNIVGTRICRVPCTTALINKYTRATMDLISKAF